MKKLSDPSVQKVVLSLSFGLTVLNAFLNLKANIHEVTEENAKGSGKRTALLIFNIANTAARFRKIDKQED